MADLAATLLSLRHRLPDRAIVDLLDLADYLQLLQGATSPIRRVTTAELADHWSCDASTIRRRMRVLCRHGLLDATNRSGPKAQWKIKRVGPVA